MIVWWNGRGPLAIFVLFPLCLTCWLWDIDSLPFVATAGVILFVGGIICVNFGARWNRAGNTHTLYSIPLQIWGWIYLIHVWLFCAMGIGGAIRVTFFPSRLDNANRSVALQFAFGLAGFLIVTGTAYFLRKASKQSSAPTKPPVSEMLDVSRQPETFRESKRK